MRRRFLTAEWRHLLMLNYAIDPDALRPLVPAGVELDEWQGRTYVSLVGFRFLNTRVLGVAVPFHVDFDEINLRFYVRRRAAAGWRRGVVFVKEIVPRTAIAAVARWVYNEQYVARPMRSVVTLPTANTTGTAEYGWQEGRRWHSLSAGIAGEPAPLKPGSEEEFITEHYWGYVAQRDGSTVEYEVAHPPWRVWPAVNPRCDGDVAGFYGPRFAAALGRPPLSAFVAEGSAIAVYRGDTLKG